MPSTETELMNATRVDCARCGDQAPTHLTDDELEDEGWHIERPHCTCDLLCGSCADEERDQCDAVKYDMGAAA